MVGGGAVIDTSFITGGSKRRSVGLIVCGNCLLVLLVKVYWGNVRVWEVKKLRLGGCELLWSVKRRNKLQHLA